MKTVKLTILLLLLVMACGSGSSGQQERTAFDYIPAPSPPNADFKNYCGNGRVESYIINTKMYEEQCDDGNLINNDECPNDCNVVILEIR